MEHREIARRLSLFLMAVVAIGFFSQPVNAEEPLRVLFIGNSYTYQHDLPKLVTRMAKAAGIRGISERSVVGGGMTLEGHWKNGKALERIRNGKWDVVVLQDQSQRPVFNPPGTKKDARRFAEEISKKVRGRSSF